MFDYKRGLEDERAKAKELASYPFLKQRDLALRWSASGGGMTLKEFADLRMDGIKLVGGANAAGLLSLGVVLGSGKAGPILIVVKVCIGAFAAGVTAFSFAYWYMYDWRNRLDDALASLSKKIAIEEPIVADSLRNAGYSFNRAAQCCLLSCFCLLIGAPVALVGALLFQPAPLLGSLPAGV